MKLEDVRKLQQKKFREEAGLYLLEGEHLVQELMKAAARDARLSRSVIFRTVEYAHWSSVLETYQINSREMAQITETRTPQGIVAVAPMLPPAAPPPGERAIYLHEIQDPGNLGTVLRSLAWFGNFRCLLSPNSVDAYNGKVVRASMGAIFHVPIEADVPVSSLTGRYARIAALDMRGQAVSQPGFRDFDCYVFGNEARGLPHTELAALGAQRWSIPGSGAIESLNVATAVALCQYEWHRTQDCSA